VEQVSDFNGKDDLRIRTAAGDNSERNRSRTPTRPHGGGKQAMRTEENAARPFCAAPMGSAVAPARRFGAFSGKKSTRGLQNRLFYVIVLCGYIQIST
jgi:hypothetical protein